MPRNFTRNRNDTTTKRDELHKTRLKRAGHKKNQFVLTKPQRVFGETPMVQRRIRRSDRSTLVPYRHAAFKKIRAIRRAGVAAGVPFKGRNLHNLRVERRDGTKFTVLAASLSKTAEHSEDRTSGMVYEMEVEEPLAMEGYAIISDRTERERCAKCRTKHPPVIDYQCAVEYPKAGDFDRGAEGAPARKDLARNMRQSENIKFAAMLVAMQEENSADEDDNRSDDEDIYLDKGTIHADIIPLMQLYLPEAKITLY